ncbi:MAG: hypothetical protein DI536_31435 [Archangium gephyra]|uniref:Uncharacterized protein n=1 Tax=Archangium gephyra TaxID=48 RepID=A0A2W5T3J3_9BACT|nr:MAG: hypothetical protein DI536_31435 [Archangium gephyra]
MWLALLLASLQAEPTNERVIVVPLDPPKPAAAAPVIVDAGVPEAPRPPPEPAKRPTVIFAEPDAGLAQTAPPPDAPDAGEPPSQLSLRGAAEADLGFFPTGFGPENGADFMTAIRPILGFTVKDVFSIELGPTFRLRIADTPTLNRPSDVGGVLRGADWDETSDFGSIIQSLRIGKPDGIFFVDVGPKRKKTLGLGHLLWRYSNQTNADYHPSGGELAFNVGPLRGEFFASDVLAARIFAGEVAWDIGGTFTADPAVRDRYVLAFSVAHDAQLGGRPFRPDRTLIGPFTPIPATLLHLDGSVVIYRSSELRWMVMAGTGVRANDRSDLGLVIGTTLDATVKEVGFSTRLELRKTAGGFRYGYFGPQYEIQRYSDVGFRDLGLSQALIPDSGSAFLEVRAGIGGKLTFDLAAEYFFWQRLDLDGTLSLALLDDWFFLTTRVSVLGLLQQPRFHMTGGLRVRVLPSFYLLAEGGTVFFPQVDGTLMRGVYGSAGAGIDFER